MIQITPQVRVPVTLKPVELARVEDRLGFGTTYEYGALPGQVRSVTDSLGRKTVTEYDARTQRPSKVIAGAHAPEESSETVYGWETGLLAEVRVWNPQAQGYTAGWTQGYDAALRPTTLLDPEGVQEELVFNATTGDLEDVISRAQGQERRVRFGRDALGRAVEAEWSGVASGRVERRFNGGGWVDWISEGVSSRRVTWETWRGAPVGETLEVGGVAILPGTAHEVDGAGHYVGYRDTEGVTHEYPVDEENRPAGVRYGGVEVVKRRYTVGGLLAEEIRKDALGREVARTEVRYDEVGRARRAVTVAVGTGEVVGEWEWKYDAAGQIREIVLGHVGARFRYEYNGRGELVGEETEGNGAGRVPPPYENQLGGPGTGVESEPSSEARGRLRAVVAIEPRQVRYELDPGGHRVRKVVNGAETRYGYSAGGRLLWEEGPEGRVEYVYDGWGNVVERRGGGVVERYGYDHRMRQSAYVREVGGVAVEGWQYEFWPTGERRAKRDLVRGGAEVYATRWGDVAARYEEGAGGLAWRESYLQGSGLDEKVGRVGRDGSRAHWLGDQVGTLGVVLDDTGAAAETVVRDAWGNLLAGSSSERYGFAQREHDSESGLVYMRHRMYDPRAGRFTQPDPLRFNRPFKNYLYARNDPLSFTDPLGLDDTPESKARMLRHFALWYGEAGLVLLEAFRESGGTLTLKNMWWGKSSVGIRQITIDMDDEGEAADYLMDALVKAIGQLGVEQKLKVAAALGLESTAQLNLATVKSIAQETRKVLESAQIGAAIASPGAALALGVEQLAQGDYLGAALTFAGTRALRGGRGGSKEVGGTARAQEAIERHHLLPKEFKPFFERAGLDIEEYVIDLSRAQHRLKPGGLHTGKESWNKAWRQFFSDYPLAKREEILEQLNKMRKDFGLE